MRKSALILLAVVATFWCQGQHIAVPENVVTEGIPALPSDMIPLVKNYTESRGASISSWHPSKREMIISTRFANSSQIHLVKFPGGARSQLTFFDEPISSASFQPEKGNYFLFLKDIGGNEFTQIYRFDIDSKKVSLLTDGKRSQNSGIRWSTRGNRIAYGSTKRNGKDRDFYTMDPLNPSTDKLLAENEGGGWSVADWSPDDTQLLAGEGISINESRLYLLDIASGKKTRLLPEKDERTAFRGVGFKKDGKGIYLITTRESEFNRLAYFDFAGRKLTYLTTDIPWDVEIAELAKDGKSLAFVTNENGLSKAYILSTATNKYLPVNGLPTGVIGSVEWTKDGTSIGLTLSTYNSAADVYEYSVAQKRLVRWTESESGGMDISNVFPPELVTWKSFDGRDISGYLYKPASSFSGKRPVIINIHGGPEGQSRPSFIGRSNYYLNELGIAIIYPNVRGSSGYGKTFLDLDNGMKREESVKDIGALLDWVATQPGLDKDRIMVTGGSYGGYMTLAVAFHYPEKIRCALDVVGISNFNTFMKNTEAYRRDLRRAEYGDERSPEIAAFFESIAPLNNTAKIKKPLFIVQGGNDPRVPYTESIQMKDKIKENGGTVWFLMAKDEGHGFRKKNNADFQFYATNAFIAQYLLN